MSAGREYVQGASMRYGAPVHIVGAWLRDASGTVDARTACGRVLAWPNVVTGYAPTSLDVCGRCARAAGMGGER